MLGPVKVVPPWTGPALRRNMAATGKHGPARSANSKCPRFQGSPRAARFREQGFPKDPWALQGVRVEVPDPSASASWLGDVFGLDVVRIAQDVAEVRLPGCAVTFARGPADCITAVVLTGRGAPRGSVAGLHYLVTGCDQAQ